LIRVIDDLSEWDNEAMNVVEINLQGVVLMENVVNRKKKRKRIGKKV
jgi:hypothetical protein